MIKAVGSISGPILCYIFTSDLHELAQRCKKYLFAYDTGLSVKRRSLRIICSEFWNVWIFVVHTNIQKLTISPDASKIKLLFFLYKPEALFLKPASGYVLKIRGILVNWNIRSRAR